MALLINSSYAARALPAVYRRNIGSTTDGTWIPFGFSPVFNEPFRATRSAICSVWVFIVSVFRGRIKFSSRLNLQASGTLLRYFISESLDMQGCVLSLRREQFEIAGRIIKLVSVFMVNYFFPQKWATENLFHYPTMLEKPATIFPNISVSIGTNVTTPIWCSLHSLSLIKE